MASPFARAMPLLASLLIPVALLPGSAAAVQATTAQCDVVSSGPVCFSQGATLLEPGASMPALGGHWSFDGPLPVDTSGHGNHGVGTLEHGPSPMGDGYSARFGKVFLTVPDAPQFKSEDFSYSFWLFVLDDPKGQAQEAPRWCPLLRKGIFMTDGQEFANGPAMLLSRNSGHLRVAMSTTVSRHGDGEFVDSNARVLRNRWLHLAVVLHGGQGGGGMGSLLLYVNGILDAKVLLRGSPEHNSYPLFVGGDPFTVDDCGFLMYVDELRMYRRAVAPHELQAEAASAFAGVEPSFVHLGCLSCSLPEAIQSCPSSRHICSAMELHTGGYQVARSVGWLTTGAHVWTQAAVLKARAARQPTEGEETLGAGVLTSVPHVGLALCCEGPP